MTDGTRCGFSAAIGDESLSFLDASQRSVSDKPGSVVTKFGALEVFRHFDDAVADWLCSAI